MKKLTITLIIMLLALGASAQKKEKIYNEKGEIIKRGWNFGPLPVVGFNSDMGFQYGVCLDIFNYGDGSKYPGYDFKINFEVSTYTRGSSIFRTYSYWNNIIPRGKLFVDLGYFIDKKFNFYGFNGYAAPYYKDMAVYYGDGGPNPENYPPLAVEEPGLKESGFYLMDRRQVRAIVSMQQQIGNVKHLYYGVGLAYYNYSFDRLSYKKYDDQATLFDLYCATGLIRPDERNGNVTQVKAGIIYDSKNYENDPTRGLYFEANLTAAPDFIDKNGYDYLTFTGVFHHYIPLWGDNLTFCYRLGAQNVLAGDVPYYAMMNANLLFYKKITTDCFGGSTTGRGINPNRVIGQGMAWLNVEVRWRIVNFKLINQNWCVALNPMFDAGMVTQTFRLEEQKAAMDKLVNEGGVISEDNRDLFYSGRDESPHTAAGCGVKLIMNKNFVVSAEFAKAIDKQDGDGLKAYIGFNYIF